MNSNKLNFTINSLYTQLNNTINCFCTLLNNCEECNKLFNMPYHYCCLKECREHEFCKNCNNGIYNENFKDRDRNL